MATALPTAAASRPLSQHHGTPPYERWLTVVALALVAVTLTVTGVLGAWDRVLYDLFMRHAGAPAPGDVVIVAVDENSLSELGRWPFGRSVHAELLDRLSGAGAGAIGIDLQLSEPDVTPGADARLAAAIRANGRVVLPVVAESPATGAALTESLPVAELMTAAVKLGHVDVKLDPDGIARSTFLHAGMGSARWPSFALALAEIAGRSDPVRAPQPVLGSRGDGVWVREGPTYIPFLGPPGHFQHVSYADVLAGRVARDAIAGKTVLVGVTATGIESGLATPVSGASVPMPAVEFMANVLHAYRTGSVITPVSSATTVLVTTALAIALMIAMLRYRTTCQALLISAGACVVALAASYILLATAGLWWPPLAAVLIAVAGFSVHTVRTLDGARRALIDQKRQAVATLHSVGDAVVTVTPDGRVGYLNRAAERMTGWPAAEAEGCEVNDVVRAGDGSPPLLALERCLRGHGPESIDTPVTVTGRNGQRHEVHANVAPIRNGDGYGGGAVLALHDLTESIRLEKEIAFQASHDALTGLPNRTLMTDRLRTALLRAHRHRHALAVLFLDLDRFKWINDSYGHAVGDQLLKDIADRLVDTCRARDTVARLGGDEFLIIVEEVIDELDVATVTSKLMEAVARPLDINGHRIQITASIGVGLYPKDGGDTGTLLRHSDTAMYRAKDSGRDSVCFFSEDMNHGARRRMTIEQRLRGALGRDEFEVHYQPLVCFESGRIVGTEALLRWPEGPEGIQPSEFIPIAEECGAIMGIGEWVLETACRQARQWDAEGMPGLRISVNLSARQLLQQDMGKAVTRVLAKTGIEPSRLELEITETAMLHDAERAVRALQELKALGVRLALDDFGTGYSSLSYLRRFPVDKLKLDQSFVHDIGTDGEGAAISRAVIAMARSLEIGIVAEGVETEQQLSFLRDLECHEGQGFLICPPMSPAELSALVVERHGILSSSRPDAAT